MLQLLLLIFPERLLAVCLLSYRLSLVAQYVVAIQLSGCLLLLFVIGWLVVCLLAVATVGLLLLLAGRHAAGST